MTPVKFLLATCPHTLRRLTLVAVPVRGIANDGTIQGWAIQREPANLSQEQRTEWYQQLSRSWAEPWIHEPTLTMAEQTIHREQTIFATVVAARVIAVAHGLYDAYKEYDELIGV